ncbi:MAG TPA: multidrug transporter, partial [Massilia sp.]|nr:multidrug transporter [Massilia sp.]
PQLPAEGGATLPTATTEAPASIAWQRFFADARLRQLIELSLANNRDLRVAVLNIEQARAQYRITRADRLPTVSAAVTG